MPAQCITLNNKATVHPTFGSCSQDSLLNEAWSRGFESFEEFQLFLVPEKCQNVAEANIGKSKMKLEGLMVDKFKIIS